MWTFQCKKWTRVQCWQRPKNLSTNICKYVTADETRANIIDSKEEKLVWTLWRKDQCHCDEYKVYWEHRFFREDSGSQQRKGTALMKMHPSSLAIPHKFLISFQFNSIFCFLLFVLFKFEARRVFIYHSHKGWTSGIEEANGCSNGYLWHWKVKHFERLPSKKRLCWRSTKEGLRGFINWSSEVLQAFGLEFSEVKEQ